MNTTDHNLNTNNALAGQVALVTGGAKRVGKAIALTLAQQGMDIAFTYNTSEAKAAETLAEIEQLGRQALAIQIDFELPNATEAVHNAFTKRFDRCDALINNASSFEQTPLLELTQDSFDKQMAINARSPVMLMQAFAPMLKANAILDETNEPAYRGSTKHLGRIVNFVDIHVMGQPLRGFMAYNMAKAALMEATMTAALELAPFVTVNGIAPGVVSWADSYTEPQRERYMQRVPLGRPGTPDDAAAAVLYLVRDADYCTGQIIRLDGGRLWT